MAITKLGRIMGVDLSSELQGTHYAKDNDDVHRIMRGAYAAKAVEKPTSWLAAMGTGAGAGGILGGLSGLRSGKGRLSALLGAGMGAGIGASAKVMDNMELAEAKRGLHTMDNGRPERQAQLRDGVLRNSAEKIQQRNDRRADARMSGALMLANMNKTGAEHITKTAGPIKALKSFAGFMSGKGAKDVANAAAAKSAKDILAKSKLKDAASKIKFAKAKEARKGVKSTLGKDKKALGTIRAKQIGRNIGRTAVVAVPTGIATAGAVKRLGSDNVSEYAQEWQ